MNTLPFASQVERETEHSGDKNASREPEVRPPLTLTDLALQPRKSVGSKSVGVGESRRRRRRTMADPGRRSSGWQMTSERGVAVAREEEEEEKEEEAVHRRRQSLWGVRQLSRGGSSQVKSSDMITAQRIPMENSYHLGPTDAQTFSRSTAFKVIGAILESYLDGEQYHVHRCRNMARQLSDVIRSRIQLLLLSDRYRIVSVVSMAQKTGQSLRVVSRCLWDTESDRWVSVNHETPTLVVSATVYAVYML